MTQRYRKVLKYGKEKVSFDLLEDVEPDFLSQLLVVDFVSFDLFDTLIYRQELFSPKDLFYRVQDEVQRRLGLQFDDYTNLRIRAEDVARVRARGRGIEEITIDEIYIELSRLLAIKVETAQNILQIELDCERAALTTLKSGQQFFKAALACGKIAVIVSDTYLGKKFISEIVNRNGYGEASKIYLSSSYGKTKFEGSLYDIVLNDLHCVPGKLVHIGDNPLSDVSMPLSKGIRTFFSPITKQRFKWRHGLSDLPSGNLVMSTMLCKISKKSENTTTRNDLQSVLTQSAIQNLSLIYFAFSSWLVNQLKGFGYKRVYFAARDGLIMKRFFKLVADAAGFEIDSRYLYISRSALYPSLIFTEPETARQLFCHNWDRLTIDQALKRVSLNFEDCAALLANYGLADRKLYLNKSTAPKFTAFLSRVWHLLERNYEEHYKLLVDYLRQEDVLTGEKAAFVDIGWHGSSQNCLKILLNHLGVVKDLSGFYLGTFEKPPGAAPDFKATGFLVDNDEPKWISDLIRCGPSVLELFHCANHGSVAGYKRNGKSVLPVLEDNPVELNQFKSIIEPIQNLAYDYVSKHLEQMSDFTMQAPNPAIVARTGLRLVYAPTISEALTFGRLKIATDFGSDMKSITGALEWDLTKINGETLPDGQVPIWLPGFRVLKEGPVISVPNNNQLFCSMPFRFIEITGWQPPKGDVFLCCPNWLQTPIGNIQHHSFEEIWNGEKAREIRRSILDGSFKYCNHSLCPSLQTISGPVEKIENIKDKKLLAIIENDLTVLPYGPREIRCSYDKSCNLSCPTCRTELIIETAFERQIFEIQNKLLNEAMKDTYHLSITGSGDPFGSPFNRKWLQTMRRESMPHIKTIHLHSNGLLWTPRMWSTLPEEIREIIKSAEISIDAASPVTYSENRRGGSFETLLENLEFISNLRKKGPLNLVRISMVVQKNNYKEMPDFIRLGKRFDFDTVLFSRLMNWGTFSEEEFTSRAIHLPAHPNHEELLELLQNEVFDESIVDFGNLTELS